MNKYIIIIIIKPVTYISYDKLLDERVPVSEVIGLKAQIVQAL